MTPEQLRALADRLVGIHKASPQEVRSALCDAADQLEAVQRLHVKDEQPFEPLADITCQECGQFWPCNTYLAITAGTAPQAETCWACARENTTDVPEGDIPLCTKHWNWWVMRWLNAADEPPCAAHLITAPQEDRDE